MSAYLSGSYSPHAHYRPPLSAGPLAAYDSDDDDLSSDFDVFERDIDAEIEARLQRRRQEAIPEPEPAFQPTLSQRMLHSLQRQRVQSRAEPPRRAHASSPLDGQESTSLASTERLTVFDTHLSSRSGSSCTDRLEARISKSFLANKNESDGLAAVEEANASTMYSGRRTYPAENLRKTEHSRLSDHPPATPQETKMMEILEKERAARVFRSQRSTPEVQKVKDSGVRFHFRRGASVDVDAPSMGMSRLAIKDDSVQGGALVRAQPVKRVTDPEYTTLASQLAEIETLVDEIESCMDAPAFGTLAGRVVKEMELLTVTTQQIRTNGTTLILANVGKQQSEFTQALRRLVARAAGVQARIGNLKEEVKKLAV